MTIWLSTFEWMVFFAFIWPACCAIGFSGGYTFVRWLYNKIKPL